MNRQKYLVMIPLLGALFFGLSDHTEASGQGKNSDKRHGGQSAAPMSNSGITNNNAQWSADPTRGWVRAEERHELRRVATPAKSNGDKEKQNSKAKAKAY